jgi:dTDP-4-dehydrorhamnose 3,5-epimerase
VKFSRDDAVPEVIHIEPVVHRDDRGFFMESYYRERYVEAGIDEGFVQDNHSRSSKGVLRGLHFQEPGAQGKLIRVAAGEIFDVAVDVRVGSPTFGRWCGARLSAENARQMYVPAGFAHGFLALSEGAECIYKCTAYYAPDCEHTLLWDDATLGVEWPLSDPVVSVKDAAGKTLAELQELGALPQYEECTSS